MSKVSITITAEAKTLTNFIKDFNLPNKLISTQVNLTPKRASPKSNQTTQKVIKNTVEYPYTTYSNNPSYQTTLSGKDLTLANKFLRENSNIEFFKLSNYIKVNSKNKVAPSHYTLKNFLIKKKYSKYKLFFEDNTTQIVWKKG